MPVRLGTVMSNRPAESARTTAATGAYATTWSVLAAALPGLRTAGAPSRGSAEIRAVAADRVERCGAAVTTTAGPAGGGTADTPGLAASPVAVAHPSWSPAHPG
ncbi:hypothetical protein OG735_05935 [Streptomyces sp. NBC_01210]|uniref:hypothetical protein n=1 Tax=Streptomyces sp. NBC_01210 TaxID=2903774 RepID=UPI002E0DFCAF|nr:hypothetical protein OG735_05935 [Streptomyces sp. NBC_01210]